MAYLFGFVLDNVKPISASQKQFSEYFMNLYTKYKKKSVLFSKCTDLGLPVQKDDKMETLELIYSLAKADKWKYKNGKSEKDKIIEESIKKIRTFIECDVTG